MNWTELKDDLKYNNEGLREIIEVSDKVAEIISAIILRREELKLTQMELAERCGIKQSAIARIENLRVYPQIDTLIKILNALEINIKLERRLNNENSINCCL